MNPTRYRLIYTLLGLAFAVLVVATILFAPRGEEARLPEAVERIAPGDGDLVFRNVVIVLDMKVGYRADLFVDGIAIPQSEVEFVEPLGTYRWEPGPGQVLTEWVPGLHVIDASWDTMTGLPDPGSLKWSFRVS